jgi:hypothetical protein
MFVGLLDVSAMSGIKGKLEIQYSFGINKTVEFQVGLKSNARVCDLLKELLNAFPYDLKNYQRADLIAKFGDQTVDVATALDSVSLITVIAPGGIERVSVYMSLFLIEMLFYHILLL